LIIQINAVTCYPGDFALKLQIKNSIWYRQL